MNLIARQSTALEIAIGPVLDANGVAVTGGVVGDFKIKKTTGNFAALNVSATLTHVSAGIYDLVLTTSDTDTVGQCCIAIDDTVNACASVYLQVVEEAVYDIFYAASATGAVPVASIANNAITAASIAADAITDAKVASDVTIASVTGAVGSVTGAVGSVTGAVGSVTGNVGGNVTGSVGSIATGGIAAASFAAGAIDAAAIAADAIDASALAADAVTEIQSGLATAAALATVDGIVDAIEVDTQDIQSRLPAALIKGRIDSHNPKGRIV